MSGEQDFLNRWGKRCQLHVRVRSGISAEYAVCWVREDRVRYFAQGKMQEDIINRSDVISMRLLN